MNLNKKIWFYTEGFSEIEFIRWLLLKHFSHVKICKNEIEFLSEKKDCVVYLYNSKGIKRIAYDVNSNNHWIVRSNADAVIIICDLEKEFKCFMGRKSTILQLIEKDSKSKKISDPINQEKLFFVFSKPNLEEIYCSENNVTTKALVKFYQDMQGKKISNDAINTILTNPTLKPLDRLKQVFSRFGAAYQKRIFAEEFFSRLDYSTCEHPSVKRLFLRVKKILG